MWKSVNNFSWLQMILQFAEMMSAVTQILPFSTRPKKNPKETHLVLKLMLG